MGRWCSFTDTDDRESVFVPQVWKNPLELGQGSAPLCSGQVVSGASYELPKEDVLACGHLLRTPRPLSVLQGNVKPIVVVSKASNTMYS